MNEKTQPKATSPCKCSAITYDGFVIDLKFDLHTLKIWLEKEKERLKFIKENIK